MVWLRWLVGWLQTAVCRGGRGSEAARTVGLDWIGLGCAPSAEEVRRAASLAGIRGALFKA